MLREQKEADDTSSAKFTSQHFEPARKAKTVASKSQKRDDKMESKSLTNRTSDGRFEAKYGIGDKTTSRAIIKEVREEDWEFQERDKKGNSYYKCLRCFKSRILKSDRKKHACKTV